MALETERFSSHARARLSAVLQIAKDLVTIEDAVKALGVERHAASKVLARWQQQGWLKRVGPGIYAPIPLDASTTEQVLKDPWVLVPALFAPGYIGGWTAAEHWDLTEQLFRSVFVFTAGHFAAKSNGSRRIIHAQTHPGGCTFWHQDPLAWSGTGFHRRQTSNHC
jgi:predicted transcriptional regulator of viral defense system